MGKTFGDFSTYFAWFRSWGHPAVSDELLSEGNGEKIIARDISRAWKTPLGA